MPASLATLVAAVDAALDDPSLSSERAKTDAMRAAMSQLLADPDGRYHVLAVVFPERTSSGVHHHGCWRLIGYYRGGDEETRYLASSDDGDRADLAERDRRGFTTGDTSALLPEDHDGWHRVRNPGPGPAVSIHVLCRTPADHPHRFWERDDGRVLDFPFVEVAPGRWRATIDAG